MKVRIEFEVGDGADPRAAKVWHDDVEVELVVNVGVQLDCDSFPCYKVRRYEMVDNKPVLVEACYPEKREECEFSEKHMDGIWGNM